MIVVFTVALGLLFILLPSSSQIVPIGGKNRSHGLNGIGIITQNSLGNQNESTACDGYGDLRPSQAVDFSKGGSNKHLSAQRKFCGNTEGLFG